MYERILIPLDGSALAEAALEHAEELAVGLKATIILFTAITPLEQIVRETLPWGSLNPADHEVPVGQAGRRFEAEKKAALEYFGHLKDRLVARGVEVDIQVGEGRPADAILGIADSADVSLIVMSTHGRGGVGRAVHGSVADEIIRNSRVPLLLVRPPITP